MDGRNEYIASIDPMDALSPSVDRDSMQRDEVHHDPINCCRPTSSPSQSPSRLDHSDLDLDLGMKTDNGPSMF